MKEEVLTNQKETDRAIKAAVDQSRKVLKYENTHRPRHGRTNNFSSRPRRKSVKPNASFFFNQ